MHSVGSTFLYTTEPDRGSFYVTDLYAVCEDIDGLTLGTVVSSLGTNSSSYNNIIPAAALIGVTSADLVVRVGPDVLTPIKGVPQSTSIYFKVITPLTLGEGELRVVLAGFYSD